MVRNVLAYLQDSPCRAVVAVFAFVLVANIAVVATPGFRSHDELQMYFFAKQYGLERYLEIFGKIVHTTNFGVPMRPLGRIVSGVALYYFLPNYPFLIQLVDVSLHGLVAILLYVCVRRWTHDGHAALIASLLFAASPLTMLAVGWPGAVYDPLYVMFSIAAVVAGLAFVDEQEVRWKRRVYIVIVGGSSTLALLSKETAVVIPLLLVAGLLIARWEEMKQHAFWDGVKVCFVAVVPVILYMLWRSDALIGSLGETAAPSYRISPGNVSVNAIAYFFFPFTIPVVEVHTYKLAAAGALTIGVIAQLTLMVLIARYFRWKGAIAYALLYFIPLLPVLPISSLGSHYLYGSGAVMAGAMAAVWVRGEADRFVQVLMVILVALLLMHTVRIQKDVYDTGVCQARLIESIETVSRSNSRQMVGEHRFVIWPDVDSPRHVLLRALVALRELPEFRGAVVAGIAGDKSSTNEGAPVLRYDRNCRITVVAGTL